MTAFATADDLAGRLNRTFTASETTQADLLLNDAATYLRDLIGAVVYPQATSTITVWVTPESTHVSLGVSPVISVGSLAVAGAVITDFDLVYDQIVRPFGWWDYRPVRSAGVPLDVTVTHGYITPPENLVAWNCVLVAQVLANIEDLGSMGGGGVTSLSIDDYRKSWSAADAGGFSLPVYAREMLRAKYGAGADVT